MSVVRPFPARVVRQDRAQGAVSAMSDSLEQTRTDPVPTTADPSAYDESPAALYVYRQHRDGVAHTGLVCEVAIRAFVDRRVRGHEAVQPARVEALRQHHAKPTTTPALVTLLHRPGAAFANLLDETCRTPPLLDFDGPGRRQTVWRVDPGPATDAVTDELAAVVLYVADGHHRVAAGLESWRLAGQPPDAGLLCVVQPMDGLCLSAFHRRLTGPVSRTGLLDLLRSAHVQQLSGPPAPEVGSFGLYVDGAWFAVTPPGGRGDGQAGLDIAVLEEELLGGHPHTLEIAPARTSVDELTRRCDGDGGALFTLAPPPLGALTALADSGRVMPPKTTYFEPKPCTGIFLRPGR